MKKILKISSLALFLIAAIACENDDQKIIQATGGPELLTPVDGAEYVLLPENEANEATTLVWNHADYTLDTEVNYEVEVALSGTEFANIVSGGSTTNRFMTWSVEELNTVALTAGLVPYETADVDVRVKASLGDNAELVSYSNVITVTLTPYTNDLPKLWIPGSYQSESGYGDADWTHATAPTLASEGFGNTNFEGYLYLANNVVADSENGLKFSSQGDWNGTNYGDDGTFSNVLSPTGGNIGGNAGYYRVKVDTEELTYNLQPVSWGIIGDATTGDDSGWNQDVDLTYNPTTKKLELASINLTTGLKFKFRGNNAWSNGFDFGTVNADGFLVDGGDLVHTGATGNYKVILDLSNPRKYTYTLVAL
ncbi:SusE domain-containing protein [Flavobacterium aquatile]|uniref:SusE outer membrane protein domain-containing protein n=1 Tax=Flavobacterium aquatile LMG 4008 = ATCC 11947 TaxID=1453498 RepID=A0A095STH8_9FLAO|nr:SusE domain-containing protein [Flavobacterium aquatile]KGD67902.1 hypothetical protein LG45_06225 [Flavobacterium aquatile LMG 4008 = ATCC 11947]OXA65423.1 hypothetical protein B0A61_15775 [Flavobacterium aquatile LMG 4008 = ATCC 11947]GEC78984.1 hypothetical protein FAQ01_18540 [Flavobacterium aquatile]